jgi:hypothetical protein
MSHWKTEYLSKIKGLRSMGSKEIRTTKRLSTEE